MEFGDEDTGFHRFETVVLKEHDQALLVFTQLDEIQLCARWYPGDTLVVDLYVLLDPLGQVLDGDGNPDQFA